MLTEKLANDIAVSARIKTAGIFGTAARDLGEEIAPGATARILKGLGLGLGAGAGAYGIGTALGEGAGLYNDTLNAENANAAAADMAARVQKRRLSNKLINDSQVALPQDITPDSFNSSVADQFGKYMSGGPARRAERAYNQRLQALGDASMGLAGASDRFGNIIQTAANPVEAYAQQVSDNIARNRAIGPGMAAAIHATHNPVHAINGPATMPATMGASLAGPDYNAYNDAMRQEATRQAMHDLWRQNQMAAAGGISAGNMNPDYAQTVIDMNNNLKNNMYDTYNAAVDNAKTNIPAALEATGQARRDLENYIRSGRAGIDIRNGVGNAFNAGVNGLLNAGDKVMNFINKPRPQVEPRWYPGAPQYGQPIQPQY